MTDTNELRSQIKEIVEALCHEWDGFTDENYYTEGASNYWSGKEVNRLFDELTAQTQAAYKQGYIDGGIEQLTKGETK